MAWRAITTGPTRNPSMPRKPPKAALPVEPAPVTVFPAYDAVVASQFVCAARAGQLVGDVTPQLSGCSRQSVSALHRLWEARADYNDKKQSLRVWFFCIAENVARDVLKHGWHKDMAA
jgi:hypothetical protein